MAWVQRPTRREDLVLEDGFALDGSGGLEGGWMETSGFNRIRLVARFNNYSNGPSLSIEEGIHVTGGDYNGGPYIVRSQAVTLASGKGYAEFDLGCRYFRFVASGGGATEVLYLSVRSVG